MYSPSPGKRKTGHRDSHSASWYFGVWGKGKLGAGPEENLILRRDNKHKA